MILSLLLTSAALAMPATDGRFVIGPVPQETASPLTLSLEPSKWHSFAAATVSVDPAKFTEIAELSRAHRSDVLVRGVPLGADRLADLLLHEVTAITSSSQFVVAHMNPDGSITETPLDAPQLTVLAGEVDGEAGSMVILAHGDMGTMGYVRSGNDTYLISSGPQKSNQPVLSFNPALVPEDTVKIAPLACELLEFDNGGSASGGLAGGLPCRSVDFAIETDEEFLNIFSSQNAANAWGALLLAATTEIYQEQLNTHLEISYMRLWDNTDPWTASGTSAQLTDFRSYWESNMTNVDRDLAHFLSGRGLGGGVAWLGGLCGGSYAYALSANLSGYFPYPLQDNHSQNWDIMVFSHEVGHNFGTGHTHDSYNPPIDNCAGGDCSVTPNGTIMSYCHLCSGGLSNILLEFHPRVETVILGHLNNASCDYTGNGQGAVAIDDEFDTDLDLITVLDVLANDEQESCGAISISAFDSTSNGGNTINLLPGSGNNRDRLEFYPQTGYSGIDTLSYTIEDETGNSATATVTIAVSATVYFFPLDGIEDIVLAEGQTVEVTTILSGTNVDTSSCMVAIDDGNGVQYAAMALVSSNFYRGTLPTLECPAAAEMVFSIQSPSGATFESDMLTPTVGFSVNDMEGSCCLLWQVTGDVNDTNSGMWEIGTPDGNADRGDPANDFDGSGNCWLTGAASGNTDVDGGETVLRTGRFTADENTVVTWAQWYDNSFGGSPGADTMTTEISNNAGSTWVLVETVGPLDSQSSGGWFAKSIQVADYVEPTNVCYLRWTVSDLGEGSVIEAAIDAFGSGECEVDVAFPGDLNGDGFVDGADLATLLGAWNTSGPGDFDSSGNVDGADLAFLLGNWTA